MADFAGAGCRGRFLIVGGGLVGGRAAALVAGQSTEVFLSDRDPRCPASALVLPGHFFEADAGDALAVARRLVPRWVIPAVPLHLAALWLRESLRALLPDADGLDRVVAAFPPGTVLSADRQTGTALLSLAPPGQVCPRDCLPPRGRCAFTGESRPAGLVEIARGSLARAADVSRVLVSRQIAPGLGALPWDEIESVLGLPPPPPGTVVALATTSACHGVVNVFAIRPV